MRILGFGTYDLGRHPRVGIVLSGLGAHGDTVLTLNEPLGFSTAERVRMLKRPWSAYRLVFRLISCWLKLTARSVRCRRHGRFDVVVVGYLGHFDVFLARLLFPRTYVALDLMIFAADTARDRGVTSGLKLRLLDALDRFAVWCADLVLLDTDEHIAILPPRARDKAVVVPVGASGEWFAAGEAAPRPTDGTLRVVFFGLFAPLQGTPVIGKALGLLADRSDVAVTLIGSGQDREATERAASGLAFVTWLDWVESSELPAVVAAHDVCLGIFGTTPKAMRVVPNKVYEGAAAGCAIVTSDTAPQRRALGEAGCFVPPGDSEALAAMLRKLADQRELIATHRVLARAVAAERFTPSAVVLPLRERLLQRHGGLSDPD